MTTILKIALAFALILTVATASKVQGHHTPAASPYASALSDLAVGTAVAQDCPCQTCIPEFGPWPSGCVSTTEETYCMVLINHSTGEHFCGWGEVCFS